MPEIPFPSTARDSRFEPVLSRLTDEFSDVHHTTTVTRCVDAARHGAEDVTGQATPELVERIARQHLQVLALAFSERA
ncbi:hypothetical protein [Nocardiopsis halotolerans]|uniref:hypothetical protein n=1 Tax=Nocardiopsis halotolerans TaxID=124252 RepID=UPI000347F88A|nr:hypothetical protein [Nocardiopsis halotolerans]